MEKYTIEAYEQYTPVAARPKLGSAPETVFTTQIANWAALEPRREEYGSLPAPQGAPTLLWPDITPPAWAASDEELAGHFLRALGRLTNGGKGYAGVVVTTAGIRPALVPMLLQACMDAFTETTLIVPVFDAGAITWLKQSGHPFSLLLSLEKGSIALREAVAGQSLQRLWQTAPVFLQGAGSPEAAAMAAHFHAVATDSAARAGSALALRRLTWPKALSTGGALPLRFWWQVVGTAPVYGSTAVKLKLRDASGQEHELALHDKAALRPWGDATYNEVVQLPAAPAGDYTLLYGVFRADGTPLALASEVPGENGWYEAGALTLDNTPRPGLYTVWDEYYPEGYYPLVDPQLPN